MTVALAGWHIRRVDIAPDAIPQHSRIHLDPTVGELTLEIADSGSLTVSAAGCVTHAADPAGHRVVSAVGGDWAWGQWSALRGAFAFHGATVARDHRAIAILGLPRSGCSLTALALVRRGWRLVADGTCLLAPVDPAIGAASGLRAATGRQSLQIDSMITTAHPPTEPFRDAETPRPRNNLSVAIAQACPLDQIVVLQPSNLRTTGVMVTGSVADPAMVSALRATTVVGDVLQAAFPEVASRLDAFCDEAVATVPVAVALVPPGEGSLIFSPRQIADLIEEQFPGVTS